jgi:hypothetical protein
MMVLGCLTGLRRKIQSADDNEMNLSAQAGLNREITLADGRDAAN